MRPLLMVAFHFPPLASSSGVQRTLRFCRDLPVHGWKPLVLTAHPRAYGAMSDGEPEDVPAGVEVERAMAFDAARHLSLFGRYPAFLALPDRWASWRFGAERAGRRLVRERRPAALWSTYPIATAHLIGASLARATGLPWVADFRDPMAHEGYPADEATWQSFKRVEEQVFPRAAACVFATDGAARLYRDRYPAAAGRIRVIENGYDEESFRAAERELPRSEPLVPGAVTLLHSGIVYPEWRNPEALFAAVRGLLDAGRVAETGLRLRFRAPVHVAFVRGLAEANRIGSLVEILPPVSYREALKEMLRADALLALQSGGCNDQVPAKLYEYFRAGRPVLALTDPVGETAAVMRRFGLDSIARLDDASEIAAALDIFLRGVREGSTRSADAARVRHASRTAKAAELAALLDEVTSSAGSVSVSSA